MCIYLRPNYDKPYNLSKIRYKVISIKDDLIISHWVNSFIWKPFKFYKADDRSLNIGVYKFSNKDIGFHCFIKKSDAKDELIMMPHQIGKFGNRFPCENLIAKIEVKGFISSGYYDGYCCETWKHAKLIGLETRSGHKNIINRFIKK